MQLEQFYDSLWAGPFMKTSTKAEVAKYMAEKDTRQNYQVFKGISQSPSIVELSQRIGDKYGLPVAGNQASRMSNLDPNMISPVQDKFAKRGSYSLEQTQVLNSNTPLIMIRKDDIAQLTIENPRETRLRKDKLTDLLS